MRNVHVRTVVVRLVRGRGVLVVVDVLIRLVDARSQPLFDVFR